MTSSKVIVFDCVSSYDYYIPYYLELWPVLYKNLVLFSGWDKVHFNKI